MAHEIDMSNGMAAFAHVGAQGWHGLGQKLAEGASLAEWATAAGMAWRIESGKVNFPTPDGMREMPDRVVLYRSDTRAGLGIVSESYQAVQPLDVLKFMHEQAEANGMTLDTAGCLFGGKRFWSLAKIGPDSFVADTRDKIRGYLLLVTSADGTLATEGRFVCERVVCNNTLEMARGEGNLKAKVSHRSVFKAGDMRRKLGLEGASLFESTMAEFRALARAPMTGNDMIRATIQALRPDTYDADGNLAVEADKLDKITRSAPVQRVAELAISGNGLIGADMAGMRGTAYGWENALTQFVDHEARSTSADNRMNSAMLGDGADVKRRAHTLALAHAGYTPAMATSAAHAAIQADSRAVGTMDGSDLLNGLLARPFARLS
jgi:phage/plasmid-like protein (TIGR03299 family)